ncbi:MAG TPA: glycosyltransferase, partial [Solirubrobacteraceae bacterium]|nr:glycosyltransferase [Solirubrobacteraceae bacterium]
MSHGAPPLRYDVVVPTTGRPSLRALLEGLAGQHGPAPGRVVLADDRVGDGPAPPAGGIAAHMPQPLLGRTLVVRSFGRGPAAARNAGWRAATAPWIVFL